MRSEELGYTALLAGRRAQVGYDDLPVARVISESREAYVVKNENGEYLARVTGKRMFEATSREDYPSVGDWVVVSMPDREHATIQAIIPRATFLARTYRGEAQLIAANVDVALVVEAADRDFNLNRFERYFALAQGGGVWPAIVLNKVDLLSAEDIEGMRSKLSKRFPNVPIFFTSTSTGVGLNALANYFEKGKTYCFLGSSGVGKSTLINYLIGDAVARTGSISSYSNRGTHVTTQRQMHFLPGGGIVIDNPGMRQVGMGEDAAGINESFGDVEALAAECRYRDCTHTHEPGCAVREAVQSGALDEGKVMNYQNLKKEASYQEMDALQKRQKDRAFGKFLKRAKQDLKKFADSE